MANPNIALSFKSPQFRSPLETATRVQQLATNAMTMQKAQREAASLNALRDYIGGGGTLDTPEAVSAAIQAGADPDTVRALATQNLDVGKFQADRKKVATGRIFNRLPAVDRAGEAGNDQAWVDWLNAYGALGDEEAAEAKVYLNLTGGKYDPAIVKSLMAGAEKYFEKTTPQAKAELTYGLKGEMQETRTGGITGTDQGVYPLQSYRLPTPTAPRKGTVMVEPSVTVEPGVGGPMGIPESTAPMMPGAKSPRLSASMANSLANLKSDADYKLAVEAIRRADPAAAEELLRVMPVFDPAKAEGIREAGLAEFEVIPQDNQPGLVAGERGGMGGPFIPTGQQAYGKNPMQAPMPGSAIVPLPRIAAEKRAEAQASQDVQTATEQTKKLAGKKQVSTILGKMRDAYEQLEKAEAIPSEKRGSFSNVLDYLGSSTLGREAQKLVGTEESKYLSRIVNMRKALATAIKNATGMSAQEMNSNVELQLTLDTLTDPTQGIEAARMALADLEEIYGAPKEAAPTSPRRTPVMRNIPRAAIEHLRKNPSLSAAFDAKYGKGQAAKVLGRR